MILLERTLRAASRLVHLRRDEAASTEPYRRAGDTSSKFWLLAFIVALSLPPGGRPSRLSAQAPRSAHPASRAPLATTSGVTTEDFRWLTGTWEGRMRTGSAVADLTFGRPNAGLLVGVMRLVDREKVLVVELISLVDSPVGPELRFRHFSPSLEAYESQFRQSMRMKDHASDRDTWENAVAFDKNVMSTQPRETTFTRHGEDEFVGHSRIIDGQGKPAVVEVTYRRVR